MSDRKRLINGMLSKLKGLFLLRRRSNQRAILFNVLDNRLCQFKELDVLRSGFTQEGLSVRDKQAAGDHFLKAFIVRIYSELYLSLRGKVIKDFLVIVAETIEDGYAAAACGVVSYAAEQLGNKEAAYANGEQGNGNQEYKTCYDTVFICHLSAPGLFNDCAWRVEDEYTWGKGCPFRVFTKRSLEKARKRAEQGSVHAE